MAAVNTERHVSLSGMRHGTDPRRYNAAGYECADLCAWTFSTATFSAGGGLANVRWNCPSGAAYTQCTSRYYLIQVCSHMHMPTPKLKQTECLPVHCAHCPSTVELREGGGCAQPQQDWVNVNPGYCALSF